MRPAALLLLALLAGGCRAGTPTRADALPTVRLGYQPFLSSAPLFIALDQGLFAAQGLHVEAVAVAARDVIPALTRGDIDASSLMVNAGFFTAVARGAPLRLVADKGSETRSSCAADAILASPAAARRPRIPASLRGARVGFVQGSVAEFALDELLAHGGLGPRDYVFVQASGASAEAALASGRLDFRVTSEPEISSAVQRSGGVMWLPVSAVDEHLQWAAVAFRGSLLRDATTARRFLRAYLRALERYREGKTAANVASVSRYAQLAPDLVRQACWPHVEWDGHLEMPSLLAFEQWAQRRGYLERVLAPAEFADQALLAEARRRGGP